MSKSADTITSLDCNSPLGSSRYRRGARNMEEKFPILYGRRIANSHEFINVQSAVMKDLLAGKISVKEANAVNRESRKILKMVRGPRSSARAEIGR